MQLPRLRISYKWRDRLPIPLAPHQVLRARSPRAQVRMGRRHHECTGIFKAGHHGMHCQQPRALRDWKPETAFQKEGHGDPLKEVKAYREAEQALPPPPLPTPYTYAPVRGFGIAHPLPLPLLVSPDAAAPYRGS